MWASINEWNRSQGGQDVSKTFVYRHFNEPRNSVKHHTPGTDTKVSIFKVAAAAMMARRATSAADLLNLKYKNKKLYQKWLAESELA